MTAQCSNSSALGKQNLRTEKSRGQDGKYYPVSV